MMVEALARDWNEVSHHHRGIRIEVVVDHVPVPFLAVDRTTASPQGEEGCDVVSCLPLSLCGVILLLNPSRSHQPKFTRGGKGNQRCSTSMSLVFDNVSGAAFPLITCFT